MKESRGEEPARSLGEVGLGDALVASDVSACDVTAVSASTSADGPPGVERLVSMLTTGSSAPALVEALGGRRFVLKLLGSGLGPRGLAVEYVASEIGRRLGLKVPAVMPLRLAAEIAEQERHAELADLLRASAGVNLGLVFLDDAEELPRYAVPLVPIALASRVVWFDALMKNVDRTARNPNLLLRHGDWWLIDHGACRVFEDAAPGFALGWEHLLLHRAAALREADEYARTRLSPEIVRSFVEAVPREWWEGSVPMDVLPARLESSGRLVEELEAFRLQPAPAIGPPKDRRPDWARRRPGA